MRIDKSQRRGFRGFTLVELLVVIGIIALLIAILLPVLRRAKEAGNTVKCMSQQRQIMTAMMMYVQENKGRFGVPPSIGSIWVPTSTFWDDSSLMYYMDTTATTGSSMGMIRYDVGPLFNYLAPGLNKNPTPTPVKPYDDNNKLYQIMNCPSDPVNARTVYLGSTVTYKRNFSYSWNTQIRPDTPYSPYVGRTSKLKSSSHKILLIEELAPNDGVCWVHFELMDGDDVPSFRHAGRANMGFADGHVEGLEPTQMGWERIRSGSLIQHPRPIDINKNHYYFALHIDQ
jgi:prepilin-type processing-associated H-X9-DG protein/prepilin-type N-terminal cleavage/methylation domain-containing protein